VVSGVVVRDRDGLPVGDASAYLAEPGESAVVSERVVRTDAAGRFRLSVEDGVPGRVHVWASALRPWREPEARVGARDLVIRLGDGALIEGRVLDERDDPVEGARVFCHFRGNRLAWPHGPGSMRLDGLSDGAEAVSDAQGKFQLTGLPEAGSFQLGAEKPRWRRSRIFRGTKSYERMRAETVDLPTVVPGSRDIVVRMRPLARLGLHAINRDTGTWIEGVKPRFREYIDPPSLTRGRAGYVGAEDVAMPVGYDASPSARTEWSWQPGDEERVFVYFARDVGPDQRLPPRFPVEVEVRAWAHAERLVATSITFGETERVDVEMQPTFSGEAHPIRFAARFEGGKPFTGRLQVSLGEATDELAFTNGLADRDLSMPIGLHTLGLSGAGWSGEYWVPAGADAEVDVGPPPHETEPFPLTLRGESVRLHVRDEEDRAVDGFSLRVVIPWRGASKTGGRRGFEDHGWLHGWDLEARAESSARTLLWLPPGANRIQIMLSGVGSAAAEVECFADGRESDVTLRLARDPPGDVDRAMEALIRDLSRTPASLGLAKNPRARSREESDATTRMSKALGRAEALADPRLVGPLLDVLREPAYGGLRMFAARALAAQYAVDAVPLLIEAVGDADKSLRADASNALMRITGRRFGFAFTDDLARVAEIQRSYREWWESNEARLRQRSREELGR
jgi:hypothetical protein